MNSGFIFQHEDPDAEMVSHKYTCRMLKTYKNTDALVSIHAPDFLEDEDFLDQSKIQAKEKELKAFSPEQFSNMCTKMVNCDDFYSAIYSLLEANRPNISLQSKGALLSVVLEMMTKIISTENKDKILYIKDKKVRTALVNKLLGAAAELCKENGIEDFDSSPLKKKIDSLNAPTNQDKLSKSFAILGISLTPNQMKTISMRNSFLHGRNVVEGRESQESFQELYIVILDLSFLIHKLLFKYVGYDGPLIDLKKRHFGITSE